MTPDEPRRRRSNLPDDLELSAMEQIRRLFLTLDPFLRERVMAWMVSRYALNPILETLRKEAGPGETSTHDVFARLLHEAEAFRAFEARQKKAEA